MNSNSALVLFSGGQDSTVCLAWALSQYEYVETIGFSYGQRHQIELSQRPLIREKLTQLNVFGSQLGPDTLVDLSSFRGWSHTALTDQKEISVETSGLPNTFIPGRNLIFLTYASIEAYRRQIMNLIGGMCEVDYSGYPDCRNETIKALALALSLGLATSIKIQTPLMFLNKMKIWDMAFQLGGNGLIELIIELSHTCYLGDRTQRHAWGYGCGSCPACTLRAKGYEEWNAIST
ncbi:MAG: 7-cyano-7-deazaguanine synthase QueC [Hyphomicrobium sp.]